MDWTRIGAAMGRMACRTIGRDSGEPVTTQDVLNSLNGLPLMDLYKVRSGVGQAIEKQLRLLIGSVSVEKNGHGTTLLKHPINGNYIVKACAFRGRLRMWKMIPGKRGLKQGPVVVNEHSGDLDSLRIHVALGYYKDS